MFDKQMLQFLILVTCAFKNITSPFTYSLWIEMITSLWFTHCLFVIVNGSKLPLLSISIWFFRWYATSDIFVWFLWTVIRLIAYVVGNLLSLKPVDLVLSIFQNAATLQRIHCTWVRQLCMLLYASYQVSPSYFLYEHRVTWWKLTGICPLYLC